MTSVTTLSIDLIRLDGDTQCRVSIDEDTVADYAEMLAEGNGQWPLGPLHVFHDGTNYWLSDGFHRTLAAARATRASVPCVVHKGSAADARIFGMTANDEHGLRMSRADKRKCVEWLLKHGGRLTQVDIAGKAGVSERLVRQIVAEQKDPPRSKSSEQTGEQNRQIAGSGVLKTSAKDAMKTAIAAANAKAREARKAQKAAEKAEKAALRAQEKAERDKKKAEEKAAKAQAKEEARAAKLAGMSKADRAKFLRSVIQQHIAKAARAVCDLHEVEPNRGERDRVVKALQHIGGQVW